MTDLYNSLYREYIHYKALESDRGIVSSTTFEEWLESHKKSKSKNKHQ